MDQGFFSTGELENIKTITHIHQTFKYIRSGIMLQGNIPFSVTASIIINILWFWINDHFKRNQDHISTDSTNNQKIQYLEIYCSIQEHEDIKHGNDWDLTKWDTNMAYPEWEDIILNYMDNVKYLAYLHTIISYFIREDETTIDDTKLPPVNGRTNNCIV